MKYLAKIKRTIASRLFQSKEERVLSQVGALTILEYSKSRSFRRKVESTEYGKKIKSLIQY